MELSFASVFPTILVVSAVVVAADPPRKDQPRPLVANWIWQDGADCHAYNQTILVRKRFHLAKSARALMRVTADTYYRLAINGRWVNDGPARSWPEHFQYDAIDVSPDLRIGDNEILITARWFGTGDFHHVPKQAGLLAQLDATLADGTLPTLASDESWEVASARAWQVNTPKASIQMEPVERYDARQEEPCVFAPARVLFAANEGPWKDLRPRDVRLMTRQPCELKTFLGAKVVKAEGLNFCLPAARLVHPGLIEANRNVSCACGMATILENAEPRAVQVQVEGMVVAIDGRRKREGSFPLAPGRHLVLALVADIFGHVKEKSLRFIGFRDFKLVNLQDPAQENPWCFLRFPEYAVAADDLVWPDFLKDVPKLQSAARDYAAAREDLLRSVKTPGDFATRLAGRAEEMSRAQMFVDDWSWQFPNRQVVADATPLVEAPAALMHESPDLTTVRPSPQGDIELLYDLGEQDCGYYAIELVADAGVVVDLYSVEYIAPDGRIQHPMINRNTLRYITREGVNRFTSLKRRSGRYLFITLRNQQSPVCIRNVSLVQSTYPVDAIGTFSCSDARLDRIWEISTRTLKLCMEDTFTDCPLYEQTHWVGDARNESLFAYSVFGATDLARRCIRVTAQSLERYPIAGCQTPSCWDCLLPAWSFLWGISTWDYYQATGDGEFLREVWPAVLRNLQGAERYVDREGLFTAPFWNMFDWTKIDQKQKTVLHNSMFLVGAIDAARKEADVLGDATHTVWLRELRQRVVAGINRRWDPQRNAYPDAVHEDGSSSPSTCQHTAMLSILYDIIEPDHLAYARKYLLDPPAEMVRIGSPFAVLYLYEALEKLGMEDEIVQEIYRNYLPMLEAGATTAWESFPSGTTGRDGFPTRSHCHAWSSAPSYFLNRILLGVKPVAPGAERVEISPHLASLTWARGTVATVRGPITVAWKLQDQSLDVQCTAPKGVQVEFVRNSSQKGKTVTFNGKLAP